MFLKAILVAFTLSALSSCCSVKKPYNIEISTATDLRGSSVEVNVVGVNPSDRQYWESLKVDEFFGSELQKSGDNVVMKFGQKEAATQYIHSDNEIWDKWIAKGVTHLYVVASIPGVISSATGSRDPRLLVLPLDSCRWEGDKIALKVDSARLILLTPLLPAD